MQSEYVYCVAIAFKMSEIVEQWIFIKFCIRLENSSAETIQVIQKPLRDDAMSITQLHHDNVPTHESCPMQSFLVKHEITQVTQPFYSPYLAPCYFSAFPKTKIIFKREVILDRQWVSGKQDEAVDGDSNKGFCRVFRTKHDTLGELCEFPRCLRWRGAEALLSYVQFILCLLQ